MVIRTRIAMNKIVLYISAPRWIGDALRNMNSRWFRVFATREQKWKSSPGFGLTEGVVLLGAIKGVAGLGRLVLAIANLLRESAKISESVRIELSGGEGQFLRHDSNADEVIRKLSRALRSEQRRLMKNPKEDSHARRLR